MIRHYILDVGGEIPIPEPDLDSWARWYETRGDSWIVGKTEVGDAEVSTVFLVHDHNFFGDGPPILWETMIFGGEYDQHCWRYATRIQAVAHHDQIVAALRNGEQPGDPS